MIVDADRLAKRIEAVDEICAEFIGFSIEEVRQDIRKSVRWLNSSATNFFSDEWLMELRAVWDAVSEHVENLVDSDGIVRAAG